MENVVAGNIQRLRRENGLTQRAVAESLGVSFQTVSKWERGTCFPDITLLPALADLFGTSMDSILRAVQGRRIFLGDGTHGILLSDSGKGSPAPVPAASGNRLRGGAGCGLFCPERI